MSQQPHESLEPHDGIDPYNNSETERAGRGSPIPPAPKGEPAPTEQPSMTDHRTPGPGPVGGTAAGDPLAGVGISRDDAEEAVDGDTGPERDGSPGEGPSSLDS